MVRRTIAMLSCLAIASAVAPESAYAQAPQVSPSTTAARSSVQSELHAAQGLYGSSAVSLTGGAITMLLSSLDALNCPLVRGCPGAFDIAAFYVGVAIASLGLIALALAIGLHVDGLSRRDALRARHLWIAPGPGEVGLAIALRF